MSIYLLAEYAETKALLAKFKPDEISLWNQIERRYSKTFATPLHTVRDIDPVFVLTSLFAEQYDDLKASNEDDLNMLVQRLNSLQDPNYDANAEKEEEEYNRQAEKEEEERQARIKAKKNGEVKPHKELPKSGGINLEYLSANEENES